MNEHSAIYTRDRFPAAQRGERMGSFPPTPGESNCPPHAAGGGGGESGVVEGDPSHIVRRLLCAPAPSVHPCFTSSTYSPLALEHTFTRVLPH